MLISKLIGHGERTYLIFTGEDDSQWGYAIASDEVHGIEIVRLVNGAPLETWLSSHG
jgi:hypothetical protein